MMHSSNASRKKKQGVVASRQLVSAEFGPGTTEQSRTLASSKPKAESGIVFLLFMSSLYKVLSIVCVINTCFYSVIYLFTLLMLSFDESKFLMLM